MKKLLLLITIILFGVNTYGQKITALPTKTSAANADLIFVAAAGGDVMSHITKLDFLDDVTITNGLTLGATLITANGTEINVLDGILASTAELNYSVGVTSAIQTQLGARLVAANNLSDLASDPTSRTNLDVYSKSEVSGVVEDSLDARIGDGERGVAYADTSLIISFGGGGGNAADTAAFTTSTIYGSFHNTTSDTIYIRNMNSVLQGTTPSVAVDIAWHATFLSGSATHLNTTPPTITSTTTGDTDTTFDNAKIPPDAWVWCKTTTVTTKPIYMSVTLTASKIPTY